MKNTIYQPSYEMKVQLLCKTVNFTQVSFFVGVQVPSRLVFVQHGEDDFRRDTAGLRSHFQVK